MQATSDTRPKKFVFTLMPFDEAFDDIYKLGIKPACESAEAYCERIDEQIFNENILSRLYNQINKADLIVADMTGRNANVFYETGYAHALNKRVILLTQNADDIPFDLKHYPHIVYSGRITLLKDELQRRVQWYLAQPEQAVADRTFVLKYYLQKQSIEDSAHISTVSKNLHVYVPLAARAEEKYMREVVFEFSVNNPTLEPVDATNIFWSLIITEEDQKFKVPEDNLSGDPHRFLSPILLPDGTWLMEPMNFSRLLPKGWALRTFSVAWRLPFTGSHAMLLRISSEAGVRDIPFYLDIEV
jgi:hypothetical protein